jgi:coenzyme F420-0:L-glutamate ligase / coenzyme F420-1:gamma-L-glutamate ligase
MDVQELHTPMIGEGTDLVPVLADAVAARGMETLRDGDVVCVTSKVVSVSQGRVVDLATAGTCTLARPEGTSLPSLRYATKFTLHPGLAALALSEAEVVFVGEDAVVFFTLMDGTWMANAGVDLSNVREGAAILWPDDPWGWASKFRRRLCAQFRLTDLGVVLTDSRVPHLRRGVTGIAIAYAGFEGVQSEIGHPDLFGHPLRVTEKAVADDLAAAAVLVCGEAAEQTPFALVRGAPVVFTDRTIAPSEVRVDPARDLYAGIYSAAFKRVLG